MSVSQFGLKLTDSECSKILNSSAQGGLVGIRVASVQSRLFSLKTDGLKTTIVGVGF